MHFRCPFESVFFHNSLKLDDINDVELYILY